VGASFLRVRSAVAPRSAALVRDLHGHAPHETIKCAVTSDGRSVVSASFDRTLRVWDLDSGRLLTTLAGHTSWVTACAVMADGRRAVSGADDGTLKIWDLERGRELATLRGHTGQVNACVAAADGRRVVSAANDGTLRVWDVDAGRELATLKGHADWVRACALTPDDRRVVSGAYDGTLKIWDLESGRVLATLEGHADWVRGCAVTADGRRAVSASRDRTLKVWDLASGRVLVTMTGHTGWVLACAVTPDDRYVISGSIDGTVRIWDFASGHMLAVLRGHADWVRACAVIGDGRRIVSASGDGTLKVWDLERALATRDGEVERGPSYAVTPDGRRAIAASDGQTLEVRDLEDGRVLALLEGHAGPVRACAVTPDGRHAISASEDRTLRVWELETYACRFTHRGDAGFTAVTTDATSITARDEDGAECVLDWPPPVPEVRPGRCARVLTSRCSSRPDEVLPTRQAILFLAASPAGTDPRALDAQARAIYDTIERSGFRERFEFATHWAAEPLDLLDELRRLRPAVLHFSGHVGRGADNSVHEHGLIFNSADGGAEVVSSEALESAIDAAGGSIRLVVLDACRSDALAERLLTRVDCVVGMSGAIGDAAARAFSIGFYGGLGECEPISAAFEQGRAAIMLKGLPGADGPRLRVRTGVDAGRLVLAAGTP
jgi:WD40 repeat protein